MQIVHTLLQADPKTRDDSLLSNLRSPEGLRANLSDYDGNSLIIHDSGSWVVTGKAGPYSDKDCMIIYGGDNQEVRAFTDCTIAERKQLDTLLKKIVSGLESQYKKELESGELQLIIGANTAVVPGGGRAQSVYRPHIHISIFPTKPTKVNNIEVQVGTLADFLPKLGINRENKYLLSKFENHLKKRSAILPKEVSPSIYHNEEYHALDMVLPDEGSITTSSNTRAMMLLYSCLEEFTVNFCKSIDFDFGMASNTQGLVFQKQNMSYSLASYKDKGKTILRVKFTYRNPGDTGASMEIAGFPVSRTSVPSPVVPDIESFRQVVYGILAV